MRSESQHALIGSLGRPVAAVTCTWLDLKVAAVSALNFRCCGVSRDAVKLFEIVVLVTVVIVVAIVVRGATAAAAAAASVSAAAAAAIRCWAT